MSLIVLFLACNDSSGSFILEDTSHTGTTVVGDSGNAGVDSGTQDTATASDTAPPDTGTPPSDTDTDTLPMDSGLVDTGPEPISEECLGLGPQSLTLGDGGLSGFTPFIADGPIDLELDVFGNYGFRFELSTMGLDTTESMSAVIELDFPSVPNESYIANLILQCQDVGPGWAATFTPLPSELQTLAAASALDGSPLGVEAALTDHRGVNAGAVLDLVIASSY